MDNEDYLCEFLLQIIDPGTVLVSLSNKGKYFVCSEIPIDKR